MSPSIPFLRTACARVAVLACLLACAPVAHAANPTRSPILDVFPASVATAPGGHGKTTFSPQFTPSGSLWDERLDETQVFHLQMDHAQDADSAFSLRMGKGGQIYSLRGAFGESVPPSWRSGNGHLSPWNDEVWQFVAVCTTYNGVKAAQKAGKLPDDTVARMNASPFKSSFFIHNSGAYIPGDSELQSLYCPLLASEVDFQNRSLRMLNWGLIPQIKTVHRSPLLYYTQVRDVGDGIIEMTWVVHNFSVRDDVVFDHLNAPWGGTRISSLPLRYVSTPEGDLIEREDILVNTVVNVRKTGGWCLTTATDADDSPSLALVYGRDKHLEAEQKRKAAGKPYCQFTHSLYRDWRASEPLYKKAWSDWETRPANSFRNYDVTEIIPKIRIAPGTTIWFRSFLVVNRKDKTMKLAHGLVDYVDYGLLDFDAESTPRIPVKMRNGPSFEILTQPVAGTKPLLVIRHATTGRQIITTDPYYFVKKETHGFDFPEDHPHHDYYENALAYSIAEHSSEWQSLLGYAYATKPEGGSWTRLSTLLDKAVFPPTNRYHLDLWVKTPPTSANP